MNSRERVIASIQHREPDKVPVDLGSNPSSGISAIAYNNLTSYLGMDHQKTLIYDVVQQLAQPDEAVLDRFGIDVLDMGRVFNKEEDDWYAIRMPNGREGYYPVWFTPEISETGSVIAHHRDGTAIAKMPVGATFFDQTYFPHIFLHSCGSIYQLIPDLMEAGFEILNPVQTQSRDMEPEKLKKEFGKDVTFWGGGIETVGILNNATPDKVRTETLQRLEIFSRGGGFVFNTVHNILPDVPPENIIAMFEAVQEFNQ